MPYTPVWFMRQAGRSLPEYRAQRGPGSILDAVRDPALAAELTLQPLRRYDVDAAVLFSDIVVPVVEFRRRRCPRHWPGGRQTLPRGGRPGPAAGRPRSPTSRRPSACWPASCRCR